MKRAIIVAAVLAMGAGCAHSHVDEHWGESQRTLSAQQIQNPEAGDVRTPVDGMGSSTADNVVANYHERQRNQAHEAKNDTLLDLIED